MEYNKEYSFDEAKDILESVFETNMNDNSDRITVNLIGERGVGKSQFVKSFAQNTGANYIKITLTNYDDTTA